MNPESEVEILLYNWLKEKGIYVKEIFFNRTNKVNARVFTTTGLNRKPDFIVKINRGYGEEYIAVEIKDNNRSAQVYDAGKILEYYDNYTAGKTIYYIDCESIKISYFIIATQGSIESKLLNSTRELEIEHNALHTGRAFQLACGNEPEFEWNGTSQLYRNLLSAFRIYRKDKKIIKSGGPGLGILTSKIRIECDKDGNISYPNENQPHMFIMNFNNYNPNYITKWGCR
jgi:hypothetical protein